MAAASPADVHAITGRRGPRGDPRRWPARIGGVVACLVAAIAALVLAPSTASAHPLSTTAVLLDISPHQVTGQLQLPIDRLAIALNQPLTPITVAAPATTEQLRSYVAAHVSATSSSDGTQWAASVTGGRVEIIDGVAHLVFDLALRPPNGAVTDFRLHYDAIVARLLSHRVLVSSRPAGNGSYTTVGVIDWESQSLAVPAGGSDPEQGFVAALGLGVKHIGEGADHLLFLVMLLLPAPLLARRGRWVRTDNLRRNCIRVVHVVTAFAVGHSITLALAAFGFVSLPSRIVESLIALSILVSAVHAIRPFARGGEVWIATGFGLMHGLAFATLLGQLDLSRSSLVTALLGFNLGIELTQLLVVALVMPSLIVLSRTRFSPAIRVTLASAGIVLAAAWLAERTTLIAANPLDSISETLVAHPFLVAAALACVAAAGWSADHRRAKSPLKRKGSKTPPKTAQPAHDGANA
jgi:HupE / UreJ protein